MGTSKDFAGSPRWTGVKAEVTQAGGGLVDRKVAAKLVGAFVQQLASAPSGGFGGSGGARGSGGGGGAGGGGGGGRGGRSGGGSSRSSPVRGAAQRIGSFFSDVAKVGFREAVEKIGLKNADQMTPAELALAIADLLGGEPNLFDQTAVRDAVAALMQDFANGPDSLAAFGEVLVQQAQNIESVLENFLGNYVFEMFCSTTYKGILETHGPASAEGLAGQVRDYISTKLGDVKSSGKLSSIDWNGPAGAKMVDTLIAQTIEIFAPAKS
jgi:hypothetical protein